MNLKANNGLINEAELINTKVQKYENSLSHPEGTFFSFFFRTSTYTLLSIK